MPRFVDIAGCAVPTAFEMDLAIPYAMKRTGSAPETVCRLHTPEVVAILHRHGKHTQVELVNASPAQRAAWGVLGTPNDANTSTHEMRAAGIFGPASAPIPAYKVGQDWPPAAVPAVIAALNELGCDAFRPYPDSSNERQHICCRKPPKFTPAQRIYVAPVKRGDKGEVVRHVQILCHRAGNYRHRIARRTGTCGPVLVRAIKATQRELGLKPDGVWGPTTNARAERRWGR